MEKNKYVEAFIQTMCHSTPTSMAGATRRLSRGEEGVLNQLYASEKPLTPGQLQERLHVVSGRIGNVLKTLEKKGLVTRDTDSHDSRRTLVSLTDEGKKHAVENYQRFAMALELFVEKYGEEEFYRFLEEVSRFNQVFREIQKEDK